MIQMLEFLVRSLVRRWSGALGDVLLPWVTVRVWDQEGYQLMLLRRGDGAPDEWEDPGGVLSPSELPRESAVRMLEERLGLRVQTEQLLALPSDDPLELRFGVVLPRRVSVWLSQDDASYAWLR